MFRVLNAAFMFVSLKRFVILHVFFFAICESGPFGFPVSWFSVYVMFVLVGMFRVQVYSIFIVV
jgi:hypothetical protein